MHIKLFASTPLEGNSTSDPGLGAGFQWLRHEHAMLRSKTGSCVSFDATDHARSECSFRHACLSNSAMFFFHAAAIMGVASRAQVTARPSTKD